MDELENEGERKFSTLLEQIELCVKQKLYVVSLMASLAIPDIGGAIDSDDGWARDEKYVAWFDKYVKPTYERLGDLHLTGEECYYIRCSMLHQGKTNNKKVKYSKVVFMNFPQANAQINPLSLDNDQVLLIEPQTFCNNMVYAAYNWLEAVHNEDNFKKNSEKLMTLFSLSFTEKSE